MNLQLPLYKFISKRLELLAIVAELLPEQNDEETQHVIHSNEIVKYATAIEERQSKFDIAEKAANVIWTSVYFQEAEPNLVMTPSIKMPFIDFDEQLLEHIDPLILQAVADSNFSKIMDVLKTPAEPDPWISHLDKERFLDVRVLWNFPKVIIVGTDLQNPKAPQYNKVLKPKVYQSAKEIYETLKQLNKNNKLLWIK